MDSLTILTKAEVMLAEADTIQKAKELKILALTAADWAERKKMGEKAVQHCRSYALEAERKMGTMLAVKPHNAGPGRGNKTSDPVSLVLSKTPTLAQLNVSKKESSEAQKLAALPKPVFEDIKIGKKTRRAAQREIQRAKKELTKINGNGFINPNDYSLQCCDLSKAKIPPDSIDVIITDPPYPKEFLPCFESLIECAGKWLVPGGSMLVMSGQSFFPDVLQILCSQSVLSYQWLVCYLTPGGQAVQIFPRRVNTFWKPVIWLVKGEYTGSWIGDVARSKVNDNDKRFHDWGQSESGIGDLVERFSLPGQLIVDPFCGGGTTGFVALKLGRRFLGIDKSSEAIKTTKNRLEKLFQNAE